MHDLLLSAFRKDKRNLRTFSVEEGPFSGHFVVVKKRLTNVAGFRIELNYPNPAAPACRAVKPAVFQNPKVVCQEWQSDDIQHLR